MSRLCNQPTKILGSPCANLVADHEDHCAAGHVCPPPASSVGASDLQATQKPGAAFSLEELLGPEAQVPEKVVAGDASAGHDQSTRDAARRVACAQHLAEDISTDVTPLDTVRGDRVGALGESPEAFRLDRFAVGPGDKVFARGYYGLPGKRWYLEAECGHEDCDNDAYVHISDSKSWYGKNRLPKPAKRVGVFMAAYKKADAVDARCDHHRAFDGDVGVDKSYAGDDEYVACPNCTSDEFDFMENNTALCHDCGHTWAVELVNDEM